MEVGRWGWFGVCRAEVRSAGGWLEGSDEEAGGERKEGREKRERKEKGEKRGGREERRKVSKNKA